MSKDQNAGRVRTPKGGFEEVTDVRCVILMEIMLPEESPGPTGDQGSNGEWRFEKR